MMNLFSLIWMWFLSLFSGPVYSPGTPFGVDDHGGFGHHH
jgi:hypothetical protein